MTNPVDPLRGLGTSALKVTRAILAVYDAADEEVKAQGQQWYGATLLAAETLAAESGHSVERVAIVIAHLSPLKRWKENMAAARELCLTGDTTRQFATNIAKAKAALTNEDPWSTFGIDANKTRSFARNILGDQSAVTVDSWAARVAQIEEEKVRRPRVYYAVACAYRRAAGRRKVAPAVMQATTWVALRGKEA